MRAEVMDYYRLSKPLNRAGYYETEHHGQMLKNVRSAILEGRIVALCGVIGSGATSHNMPLKMAYRLCHGSRMIAAEQLTWANVPKGARCSIG